jgi:hypothetical protein
MLAWRERSDCPEPAGLVAAGASMRALLRELRQRDQAVTRELTLSATRDLLVLLGPTDRLPWVDGVRYCAPVSGVPGLLLPTRRVSGYPADLLYAALQRRVGHAAILLWDAPAMVLGLDGSQSVRPAVLDWLDGELA